MINLTIRNIPKELMDKIKMLSKINRRSINNEILCIIEKGLNNELTKNNNGYTISRETQLQIWKKLSGKWIDDRDTKDIIRDIYDRRSKGRKIKL